MAASLAMLFTLVVSAIAAVAAASPPTPVGTVENDVLHFSFLLQQWLTLEGRGPCDDFHAYVCAKRLNASQALLEQPLKREQERFDKFLWSTAGDDGADNEHLTDAELKLKHFYESCQHARSADELRSSLMYRTSGGWPAIDDSASMVRKRRNMTWLGVLTAFHDVGLDYFVRLHVDIQSNRRVVHVEPDETQRYTLRKFELLAGDVMQRYAVDAGRARLIALEILNFERNRRELINRALAEGELSVPVELNYAQFKARMHGGEGSGGSADWDAYFRKILGKPLRPTDTMMVRELPRVVQLFTLLQNTTLTRLLNWIWIDYLMDKNTTDCQSLVQTYFEPVYVNIVERVGIDKLQMAQMYADIGRAYDELVVGTPWIDEMSQQNSRQFLGRVMHLTLNGDTQLDADLVDVTLTKRNFYRNLEKMERHVSQQRSRQRAAQMQVAGNSAAVDFMRIFIQLNALVPQQNLTLPLNYLLVGERFAEHLIASGSSSSTPGAWRSMDSEREFAAFKQCVQRQNQSQNQTDTADFNANELLLQLLAQRQVLHALDQWQQKDAAKMRRIYTLLAGGRLQMTLRKLYFIGTLLGDCGRPKALVHAKLRNTPAFTHTFRCRAGDALYTLRSDCNVAEATAQQKG